jgi:hypothetical protein
MARHQGPAVRQFSPKSGEDYDPAITPDLDYWVHMARWSPPLIR